MSQSSASAPSSNRSDGSFLQSLARQPMTSSQQVEAVRRLQSQAEQRVALGQQLLATAEAKLTEWRTREKQVKAVATNAVAQMLQSDDPMLQELLDKRIARALEPIERRLAALEKAWAGDQSKIDQMVGRSKDLMDQSKAMLDQSRQKVAGKPTASAPPTMEPAVDQRVEPAEAPAGEVLYTKLLSQMLQESAEPTGA